MAPPPAAPESFPAPGEALEPAPRGTGSGWWVTARVTIALLCLLSAGGFGALWIHGQTTYEVIAMRLAGPTLMISTFQGRLLLSASADGLPFQKRFLPGLPITHLGFRPLPAAYGTVMTWPTWNITWIGAPIGPGVGVSCPCWFAITLSCAGALASWPWKSFRRR